MRINSVERRLILCTAACLLFCFGLFFGTNRSVHGVRVDSSDSVQASDGIAPSPSNEQLLVHDGQKDDLVNIHYAEVEELMSLPGIGEVLAGRILEYRETYGSFHRVQELTKVEGIGEKKLIQLLDYITVEGT